MSINVTGSVVVNGNLSMVGGSGVSNLRVTGSSPLANSVYLQGQGDVTLSQSGQMITISGSGGTGSTSTGGSVSVLNSIDTQGYASVANGGTITHGLGAVPDSVQLSASGSNPLQFAYTTDATNITVYHTAGGNAGVYWRAEKSGSQFSGSLGPYNYIIYSGSGTGGPYFAKDADGILSFTGSDATTVINNTIVALGQSGSIYVKKARYPLSGRIIIQNIDGVSIFSENGTVYIQNDNVNSSGILILSSNNCRISGGEFDGNWGNNNTSSSGIVVSGGNHNIVDHVTLIHWRRDGFQVFDNGAGEEASGNGIFNSLITECGWNGVTFGGGDSDYGFNNFACNNEISYCSDVGISTYNRRSIIMGNNIHDLIPGSGSGTQTWGIGSEAGGQHVIEGNLIDNIGFGIWLDYGTNTVVSGNNITNSKFSGIIVSEISGSCLIEGNIIKGWATSGLYSEYCSAINISASRNNLVTNNFMDGRKNIYAYSEGIRLYADNNTAKNNYILNSGSTTSIAFFIKGNNITVEQNHILSAGIGFQIDGYNWNGIVIKNNEVTAITGSNAIFYNQSPSGSKIYSNNGYNPKGLVTTPVASGSFIFDKNPGENWGYSEIVSGSTYTVWESPAVIYPAVGTTTTNMSLNSQAIGVSYPLYVEPGQTFSIGFSGTAPLIFKK